MSALPDLAADSAPTRIATVRDAASELARCKVAADVIADHEKTVRSWLLQRALDTKEAEGASPRWQVSDDDGRKLASVSLSDPEPKAKITDRVLFAGWAEAQRWTVRWEDHVEVRDHATVAAALASFEDGDIDAGEFADLVRPALEPQEHPVLPESCADDVLADSHLHADGSLVDPTTGEVIPGIGWKFRSRPTLSVRLDSSAKKREVKRLASRLPDVDGGDES